ncbi:MAG: electron transfer flavoprotein subunit beta/FixA family protein [Chlorobium sp.]
MPDTASVIGFVDGTRDLSRVNEVMNPYDEYALEEAVRLKERFSGSVVTAFSVAPPSAKEMLRKALAMGADRAVLVSGTEVSDPYQTALALSRSLSSYYANTLPDLVFCGKQSTDFQSAQVPLMLAELLGMGAVAGIRSLSTSAEGLRAEREIEGGVESYDLHYPALFSVEKGLNIPRKTTIKSVIEARKKTIDIFPLSLDATPFVVMKTITPLERKKKCQFVLDEKELIRLLGEERNLL